MDELEDYQDVEYIEEQTIRGEVLYYSTGQVAKILDIPDSKVRYYTTAFDDILHIEIINKQRKFTKADIDKMKFILELKNEGMSIKQIQEYCQEVDFNSENGIQIKESNPLSIQTLAKALLEEQERQLNIFKDDMSLKIQNIMDNIVEMNIQNNEKLKEDIVTTIDEVVSDKLETKLDELKSYIDQRELEYKTQDQERMDMLRRSMEETRKNTELNSKKSIWSRIFNK